MKARRFTDLVWLPRATNSFFSFRKLTLVKARVLPTLMAFDRSCQLQVPMRAIRLSIHTFIAIYFGTDRITDSTS